MGNEAGLGRGRTAGMVLARVIDFAVWLGSGGSGRLAHRIATLGGTLEWALRPGKRRRLATNLAHAVGHDPDDRVVRRLVRRELVNEAHRSADLLWSLGRPEDFLASAEFEGVDDARRTVEEGRGLILVGTHLGGWEVATSVPAAKLGASTSVIVRDDWLAWGIEHARVAAGLRVLYPKAAALTAARLLRDGQILLALADDARHAGHFHRVRFLDGEAEIAGGVVALARLTQSPIVTFNVLPLGRRRWKVTADPALPPPAPGSGAEGERILLQEMADRWSRDIRANPEHWAASHPIAWVEDA
jgi:lauroyl/myristoyl acyltransferase